MQTGTTGRYRLWTCLTGGVFTDFRLEGKDSFEFSSENKGICAQIMDVFKEKDIDSEIEYSLGRTNVKK